MILYNFKDRLLTSLGLLLLFFLIFNYNIFLISTLLVFGIFSLVEFFEINKKISKNSFLELINNLIFILFIFTFCIFFFLFSNIVQFKLILFILLFGCIGSDIGGYIVGKIFKGPKLIKISPKKTISGAVGSILFTTMIISLSFFYIFKIFNSNIVLISIMTSLACQIGDLFFSFLKRKAKMKDTGNILPGHGGILDRFDGVFLGMPVGVISLVILF